MAANSTCSSLLCGPQVSSPASARPICCSTLTTPLIASSCSDKRTPNSRMGLRPVPGVALKASTKWPSRNSGNRFTENCGKNTQAAAKQSTLSAINRRACTKPLPKSFACADLSACSQRGSARGALRVKVSTASAGVKVSATMSEAKVETIKVAASGAKNRPCKPLKSSTGSSTSATTSVAYSTGARTSSEPSNTTLPRVCSPALGSSKRSRRIIFSTSIIASSTITPSATAKPPNVIVLTVQPHKCTTKSVATNDTGMLINDTIAAGTLRSTASRTKAINKLPKYKSRRMPRNAVSMKFAGRCKFG